LAGVKKCTFSLLLVQQRQIHMATETQQPISNQTLNIPPDLAERLRSRRPGYDRIFDLVQQYEELPVDKREQMGEDDLFDLFIRPIFEALGWSGETATPLPFKLGEFPQLRPLILAYRDLRIVVGMRPPGRLLSSERDADYQLSQWAASIDIAFGILTNFETIRIWDFSDPTPNLILESGPRQYLTDESSEVDLLAAEIFYQRLARRPEPAQKGEFIPPAEQMQQEPIQTPVDEDIKEPSPASKEFPPWGFKEEPQSNLMKPYGEPGGPQQRFEEIMAGISFGSVGIPPRTITALVTDRQSGQMLLLLAGGALPEGAEVIQPAPQQGGNTEDKIGVVIREVFNERGLGAVARPEGERPFLSILPNQRAIGGVATPREWPPVFKFGGGSDYTQGQISQVNARVELTDDFERKIMLPDAFVVEGPDFSGPGDVGALVLTGEFLAQSSGPGDNSPVTFAAGPPQAVGVIVGHQDGNTVCLPIQPILDQLGVDLIQEPVRYLRLRQTAAELTAANDLVGGEDRLGFSHYIDAFVRLIKDKNTLPPLTIGIYGAWGSGKSFLMDKIAAALYPNQDGTSANRLKKIWRRLRPSPRLWQSDTLVVRFEAWDYNAADKLWAGLVEQIFKTLETELGWYGLLRFNLKRNLQRQWRALRAKLLPYSLIAIVIGALVVGFLLTGQGRWAVAVGGTTTIILLARQLFDLFSTSASQRIVDLFAGADYKQDIGFMGRIRADLEDFTANLPDRPDYKMKVVVFIDDLDRCDPKKAVEVLEAIKLLLELDRFIVFLALDARIITQAVEQHYGKVLTEAEITGYEYLDKIVQIPFSIPEPPPRDLRNYLGSLVGLNQAEIPPLELPAARKEPPQPAEFVAEAIEPNREETESPAIASAPVNHDAAATESPETPQPAEQTQVVQELPPNAIPPLTDVPFETIEVIFGPDEQQTFLDFHAHLDANPRRLKRLVNIYKLVRALIAVQQSEAAASSPAPNHRHILGWLVVCEQWPYAAHVMLEIMAESYKRAEANPPARRALEITLLTELQQAAQQRIAAEENQTLQKLDLKYDRLESFIRQHLHDFTLADLQRLKPFTVNFNPALSAEVRLTLSKAG
jgi:hypothetical protein